mgnify:CR=1 FL=1
MISDNMVMVTFYNNFRSMGRKHYRKIDRLLLIHIRYMKRNSIQHCLYKYFVIRYCLHHLMLINWGHSTSIILYMNMRPSLIQHMLKFRNLCSYDCLLVLFLHIEVSFFGFI